MKGVRAACEPARETRPARIEYIEAFDDDVPDRHGLNGTGGLGEERRSGEEPASQNQGDEAENSPAHAAIIASIYAVPPARSRRTSQTSNSAPSVTTRDIMNAR